MFVARHPMLQIGKIRIRQERNKIYPRLLQSVDDCVYRCGFHSGPFLSLLYSDTAAVANLILWRWGGSSFSHDTPGHADRCFAVFSSRSRHLASTSLRSSELKTLLFGN